MFKLPLRRTIRLVSLLLTPLLLITALISTFGLLIGFDNADLAVELAQNSPQSIPHFIEYSLYRQAPPEGQVLGESITALDGKTELLRQYLEWQGSPFAPHAGTFITVAKKYDLPWTLLPAICGRESTFGKKIPEGSYNCWGWGVYGNQALKFADWNEAIETVGKGLKEGYFDNGLNTLQEIEYSYAPPSRTSHLWSKGVEYFMWEISTYPNF